MGLDEVLATDDDAVFLEDPPHPGPYAPGDVICEKYRLAEPIGFGGMGAVWRAQNEVLDVPVALKLIRSDARLARCPERLLIEARAAAGIRHASVVRVFDFGKTSHGDPFIVMELLQGESLRDVLDREKYLSAVEAVRTLLPILGGIACAHGRGVIHRDLKPENIFLARDDAGCVVPKVLDFGIAKLEGDVSHLTLNGMLLGSPEYMSPEQAVGEHEVDHRVDVWAAAVVLYEMIAGRAPWESPSCPALLRAIVDDPPPKLTPALGVDARLWAILERGLAKNRDKRWTSARTFGRALAGWLVSRSVDADLSGGSLRDTWIVGATENLVRPARPHQSAHPTEAAGKPRRASAVLRRFGRPTKLTLGLTASLVLCGIGYHSTSAPASVGPALVTDVVTTDVALPVDTVASRELDLDLDDAAAPASPEAPSRPAPAIDRATPARPAHPRPIAVTPRPNASAVVAKESARSMDFGF